VKGVVQFRRKKDERNYISVIPVADNEAISAAANVSIAT
jgi:hypothetical protein